MSDAYDKAWILYKQDRTDLAIEECLRDLRDRPDSYSPHALLAFCFSEKDEFETACHHAKEAIRLGPDQYYPHYVHAKVLLSEALSKSGSRWELLERAEAAVSESLRIQPTQTDCLALLAEILYYSECMDEMLDVTRRGLAEDPHHLDCLLWRATSLAFHRRFEEAEQCLATALADDPEESQSHARLGWMQLYRGQYLEALQSFREGLRLEPNSSWIQDGHLHALKARFGIYRPVLFALLRLEKASKFQPGIVEIPIFLLKMYLQLITQSLDVLLLFDSQGRRAVDWTESGKDFFWACVGAMVITPVALFLYALQWLSIALFFLLLALLAPLTVLVWNFQNGWIRLLARCFAAAQIYFGVLALGAVFQAKWSFTGQMLGIYVLLGFAPAALELPECFSEDEEDKEKENE